MRCLAALPLSLFALAGCYNPGDLGEKPFKCGKMYPECPDGYICNYGLGQCGGSGFVCDCVRTGVSGPALQIPKEGKMYQGPHMDPGLQTCHETDPNNGFQTAFVVGDSTGLYDMLEICPGGDIDVYSLNVDPGEYVKVQIKYQITYGDLDLAGFDVNGKIMKGSAMDNDASRDNACIILPKGSTSCPCTFYAVVDGAYGAVNRYTFQMTKSSSPQSCAVAPPDMAMSGL